MQSRNYLAAATASALLVSIGSAFATESQGVIAEIYLNPAKPRCLLRVELPQGRQQERKSHLMGFLQRASADGDQWNKSYFVFNVDFIDFSKFEMAVPDKCDATEAVLKKISGLLANCTLNDESACAAHRPRLFEIEQSPFVVMDFAAAYSRQPIERFEAAKGLEALPGCVFAADAIDESIISDDEKFQRTYSSLWSLVLKFRFPLMLISHLDYRYYFLLSRMCEHKEALFGDMEAVLASEGFEWGAFFQRPDFTPDITSYVYSQIGARGMHFPRTRSAP
jgi:hypothetical protein